MRNKIRIAAHNGRSFFAVFVVFCMLLSMLSSVWVPTVQAKSSRAAIVTEVIGDVSVRKAGGSKSFTAYKEMTLNQGDFITTGNNSSLTLKIADHNDELTLGDNTEISITELLDSGDGKTSKFKMWAGSAWAKVKSLVSSEDEYEIETPTAVMGVRGTQFLTIVDPQTGRTSMVVAAGIVNATTSVTDTSNNQQGEHSVLVYPSQQISLDSRDQVEDLRGKVDYVDIKSIVEIASPKVIEALIKDFAAITKENEELKQKLLAELQNGLQTDNSILKIMSLEDLNKVISNFEALIPNLAKAAIDAGKLSKEFIDKVNEQIADPAKKIDLNHLPTLDKTAGIDPVVEALKKLQQEKLNRIAEENALLAENQKKLAENLARIQKEKERLAEANKKLEDEAKEKAKQQLGSGNSDNSSTNTGNSGSTSGGSSSGGRPSGVSRPAEPTLVSPTAAITTFNPAVIRWKAPIGVTVKLYNGSDLVATAEGKGNEETTMTLGVLPEGTYNFKAEAVRNGINSIQLSLPPLTISDTPVLISPKTDWITNVPVVVAKGPLNTKLKVLNQGNLIAEADGKGDQEVSIPLNSLVTDKTIVYDKLTLISDRNGKQSAQVQIPKITTDGSMGVLLKSATNQNNTVMATLAMKNFVNAKALYAAEVHLAYDNRLSYNGDGTVAKNPNAVFGALPQSVELLKQSKGSDQTELLYAATNYTAGSGANLITIDGEKLLIAIPLTLSGSDTTGLKVKMLYYKVVDQNGNVVAEANLLNNPVEVTVN
ncbi:FecR family protein [Paenibacillus sp. UNC451MF]|uniref:FecR family protein n=1 Tax=Paenibacillus sp. UNC451MF TaxID=1449063 RepID=UPI00068E7ADF|nr:FecR family protein [Paenibacillus sp. UNC451MF]